MRAAAYAEMVAGLFAGRSRDAAARARPAARRQRRRAADAGRVPEARRRTRSFAIVDAAMNDLLRPALYDAWHPVDPVRPHGGRGAALGDRRPDVRERRFPRAGPAPGARARRPSRDRRGRRVRHGDELELQLAAARLRGALSTTAKPHLVRRREAVDALFCARESVALSRHRRTSRARAMRATTAKIVLARAIFFRVRKAQQCGAKRRNRRRNLAKLSNVATMQAAGGMGLSIGCRKNLTIRNRLRRREAT